MRIIAIDPGYERLGIAIMEKLNGKEVLLYSDCFKTSKDLLHHERLALVGGELEGLIEKYHPQVLSVEKLYFSKNQKTALLVAEARGVILYTASRHGLKVFEYQPADIKIAVTGYGKSDKKHIIAMIPKLVKIDKKISHDDEYDAIAAGITFFATEKVYK